MSEEMKTQSLDDTVKESINENTEPESLEVPKPRRTRRTKAQIEADKKAAESNNTTKNDEKKSTETKLSSVGNVDFAGDPIISDNVDISQMIVVDDKTNVSSVEITPEIILDTDEDAMPDIEESEETMETQVAEEKLEPEIVADTPMDNLPDVEEPKKQTPQKKVYPSGEAIEALNGTSSKKKSQYVGKSIILKDLTPMFRAPHYSMRIKSYRGLVTVIEDPKGNFVKVQYLRQGFGMCSSYMESYHVINTKGCDENVSEETCPC